MAESGKAAVVFPEGSASEGETPGVRNECVLHVFLSLCNRSCGSVGSGRETVN